MSLMLYALWKAPIIEQVAVEESRRRCTTCGFRRATIKLRLPHIKDGRIYQYKWICNNCYKSWYSESKEKFPDAIEIPTSRMDWNARRAVVVAKLFPKKQRHMSKVCRLSQGEGPPCEEDCILENGTRCQLLPSK